jgi:hypothetical protein
MSWKFPFHVVLFLFFKLSLSHDLQSSAKTACYLVGDCYLFLQYTPRCRLWCLPSSTSYRAYAHSHRNRRALATGNSQVHILIPHPKRRMIQWSILI